MFNFSVKRSGKTSKINCHLSSVLESKKALSQRGWGRVIEQKRTPRVGQSEQSLTMDLLPPQGTCTLY